MPRVSDLLAALDRLPDACAHCGSVLVHVGGPAGIATVCPSCAKPRPRPLNLASIAVGVCPCAECVRARRARA